MKKIFIESEIKESLSTTLSRSYAITESPDDAELVIFDGDKDIKISQKSLAIFKNSITEGTYSDFLLYPFCEEELVFRIKRLFQNGSVFENGDLLIDTERCSVYLCGAQVHLTMLEYKLLCLLLARCGQTVDYQTIMRELWGSPIGSEIRSVRVFVNALRKKLGNVDIVKNVMGKGYVMPKIAK